MVPSQIIILIHPKLENMEDLIKSVKENKCSVGLAFDGDADRLGVISPKGEMIFPDRQMIMFSRQVIQSSPNAKIVFDVKCSKLLSDEIEKLKRKALDLQDWSYFYKTENKGNRCFTGWRNEWSYFL